MIAVYAFLIGLPVGALSEHITGVARKRKSELLDALGTFVGGVAIALSFPILYPILIVTVFLTEIWVAVFRALFSLF